MNKIHIIFLIFITTKLFSQEVGCNRYTFENGIKRLNDLPYTGPCVNLKNGRQVLSGAFKNGLEDGRWVYFTEDGKTEKIESFIEGKKDGVFEDYVLNDNGSFTMLSKKHFKDNKPNGKWEAYHMGILYQIENYREGMKEGEFKDFDFDTGEIRELRNLKTIHGKTIEDGIQVSYRKNGKNDTITFKNGIKDGLYVRYRQNGRLIERVKWIDGKIADGIHETFDENGLLQSREEYKGGIRDGVYDQYYMGKKWLWGILKNGQKEGRWEEYGDNGNLDKKQSGYYENGKKIRSL